MENKDPLGMANKSQRFQTMAEIQRERADKAEAQRDALREALDSIIDVALELDELVHYSRGVGAYIEDEGITKARAALKATEEG